MEENVEGEVQQEPPKVPLEKPSWISPFNRIVALHDRREKLVQIYEEHARGVCRGAAAWSCFHYQRAGGVVIDSVRDGPRDIFTLNIGKGELKLIPSISPAGIEEVVVSKGEIIVTYAGLGGGGVGVTRCRGLAQGVKFMQVIEGGEDGGVAKAALTFPEMRKLHIGIDDTDSKGEGATWSLANEIGHMVGQQEGMEYIDHTLVQLYPASPNKTTNCVGTVLTFASLPEKREELVKIVIDLVTKSTVSDETAIAVFEGIKIPEKLTMFCEEARTRFITIDEAKAAAKENKVRYYKITGRKGYVGAIASLGFAERHDSAVILPKAEGMKIDEWR